MAVLAVNSLATLLMFVSSCIVSAGFRELCDSLTQDKPYQYFSRSVGSTEQETGNLVLHPLATLGLRTVRIC